MGKYILVEWSKNADEAYLWIIEYDDLEEIEHDKKLLLDNGADSDYVEILVKDGED